MDDAPCRCVEEARRVHVELDPDCRADWRSERPGAPGGDSLVAGEDIDEGLVSRRLDDIDLSPDRSWNVSRDESDVFGTNADPGRVRGHACLEPRIGDRERRASDDELTPELRIDAPMWGAPCCDEETGTWLAVTSISFDISVLELLGSLARGFEVVVQPDPARTLNAASPRRKFAGKKMDFSLFYFASDESEAAGFSAASASAKAR